MRMDVSSHYLATESFSFNWLPTEELQQPSNSSSNTTRLFLNNEEEEEAAQISTFDFDVSNSSNPSLTHADKLFSNGLIVPSSLTHPYSKRERVSYGVASSPGSIALFASPSYYQNRDRSNLSSTKLKRILQSFSPRRVLGKYMECFVPEKTSRSKTGIRVDDEDRRAWEVGSNSCSNCNTPQRGTSPMIRRESDESSIYEAILYCKRSSSGST